jgi:hypothetical protein
LNLHLLLIICKYFAARRSWLTISNSRLKASRTISIESYRHLRDIKDSMCSARIWKSELIIVALIVKAFEKLLNWFKPKYESLPLSAEVVLESICPGTRSTLLSSDKYVNWRDSLGEKIQQPLWIYGPRMLSTNLSLRFHINNLYCSWIWQECPLVGRLENSKAGMTGC